MEEIILNLLESYSVAAFFGAFAAGAVTAMAHCLLISIPLMVASAAAGAKELEGRRKAAFTYLFSALFPFGVVVSFSALGFLVSKFDGFMLTPSMPTFLVAAAVCFLVALYALGFLGELLFEIKSKNKESKIFFIDIDKDRDGAMEQKVRIIPTQVFLTKTAKRFIDTSAASLMIS